MIDQMVALRRQGFSFREIGLRLGCSERTARRYAGNVKPELHLPGANSDAVTDPRVVRGHLLSKFMDLLYRNPELRSVTVVWYTYNNGTDSHAEYGGPPSILFLNEAERLLDEKLRTLNAHALRYLGQSTQSQHRFVREVVGFLYADYIGWHRFSLQMLSGYNETGEDWRPPSSRPPSPKFEYVDPFGLAD